MPKKICPKCNMRIINHNEKYCDKCLSKVTERHKEYKRFRIDEKEQKFYSSSEWLNKRAIIKDIDNGFCILCLSNNEIRPMNTVHHIIELKDDWSLRFENNNLICLCESCHQKVHKSYKISEFSKENTQKYLRCLIDKFRNEK
ncbi:HNH endonuclease [Clostridium perfringens]|nr:HNH endonuclease [Clostridium perfringens]MDT9345599.1 HNH endonuclease [Clostridium perfringens]